MKLPEFKTVKQPELSRLCGAAVCAMATGVDLDEVLLEMSVHTTGWPSLTHVLTFLGRRGITVGINLNCGWGKTLRGDATLSFDLPLEGRPCIMVVPSGRDDTQHYVFWDGRVVRDPDRKKPAEMPLEAYVVLEVWPLVYNDLSLEKGLCDAH